MSTFLPSQPDGARITSNGAAAPWAVLLVALLAVLPPIAAAEDEPADMPATDNGARDQFASCSPLLTLPEARAAQIAQPYDPDAPATLEADSGEFVEDGFSVLEGDAIYSQSNRWLNSEYLEYNATTGELKSDTPTRFLSGEIGFDTESIHYNTQTRTGDLSNAEFYLFERHARGEAAKIILASETRTELQGVMYTTCSAPDQDWYLRATDLELDQETGIGVAKNLWISFMHVPFVYVPWMDFPIDGRRKSGFLFPEFGYSSSRGDFLRVPYYFNIAPNYDATFAPYFMKKRGTLLDGQFRYLNVIGKGTLDLEYLENDRITQTTRYRGKLVHSYGFGSGWRTRLNYNAISDPAYLEDLSDSGRATEISYLAQTAQLTNAGTDYSLRISARQYETVDPTSSPSSAPYSELPAIDFKYLPLPLDGWIEPTIEVSATDFRQEFRTDGTRQHIQPELALNLGTPGIILRPAISHWQSNYDLEQADGTPLELERSVTIKSLDLGLILERSFSDGGKQTLEPHLFYLDVPYVDQDAFPLFDTRRVSSPLDQLFRLNRFTGIDRLGDTRQLTASLGSRFIEPESGRTWLKMQVARARYFEDRRVTLTPGALPETFTESDVFAALQYSPTRKLDLRLDASLDPGSGKLGIASMRFGYAVSEQAELNLSYSFRRDIPASSSLPDEPLEQAGISFIAPVGSRWKLFGKAIYSVPEERSLETMAGFEYESCCWAFRTFQRRYIRNRAGEIDASIWFQLELKGLANVGRGILDFLGNEFQAYGEP